MTITADEQEPTPITPDAILTLTRDELERHAQRCERLICSNRASEREYALYIAAMRELARRSGVS